MRGTPESSGLLIEISKHISLRKKGCFARELSVALQGIGNHLCEDKKIPACRKIRTCDECWFIEVFLKDAKNCSGNSRTVLCGLLTANT